MKRLLFGSAAKPKSREIDDSTYASSSAANADPTPAPLQVQTAPAFLPSDPPYHSAPDAQYQQPFTAQAPVPTAYSQPATPSAGTPPTGAGAGGAKKLFGFGRKETPSVTEPSNGGAQDGYDQARTGWSAGGPPQQQHQQQHQQPQMIVDPRHTQPPRVNDVSGVIGWSCAHEVFDYPLILSLCDYISLSAAASKDAARALRKEIKYAIPDAQERAVRLLGIMMRNSDLRFKQQVASKKFIAELSDLASSKKTEPRVLDMLLRVLSPLAYDYQRDAELSPITTLWNKLKPPQAPVNGAPLDPEDSLFTPTVDPRRLGASRSRGTPQRFPTQAENLRSLLKEATAAKANALMLSDAIGFTPTEELAQNELVAEFYAKCFSHQQVISSSLDWATVQAEQARAAIRAASPPASIPAVVVAPATPSSPTRQFASNNPFAPVIDGTAPLPEQGTEEEKTLAALLSANSDIIEALSLHDTRLRLHSDAQREASELRAVEELSKAETRFDRATAGMPDENGNYLLSPRGEGGEGGSGEGPSRSPSPARMHRGVSDEGSGGEGSANGEGKGKGKGTPSPPGISLNPFAAFVPEGFAAGGYEVDSPVQEEMPRGGVSGASGDEEEEAHERGEGLGVGRPPLSSRRKGTGDSEIETPAAPSEKALGKLRRVSMRTDTDPLEQQRQLEAKLREKYSRNYEDDVQRKSAEYQRLQ